MLLFQHTPEKLSGPGTQIQIVRFIPSKPWGYEVRLENIFPLNEDGKNNFFEIKNIDF
jgi:hypothetical protein